MANRPAPEIEIDEALVRRLLLDQAPAIAEHELRPLDRGWDNTNWRLGDDLIVRVPHRQVAAPLIDHEQRWLPDLASRFDVAIPAPIITGRPSITAEFPWPWSVVAWIEGHEAATDDQADTPVVAETLGRFFAQLHTAAPKDAPENPYRGHALSKFAKTFIERLDALGERIDSPTARDIFDTATEAPPAAQRVWLHGDLHTRNIVVDSGDLAGVVDWGDICSGDRATDLAGAFMLAPNNLTTVAEHAGATEADWLRARGWATHFGVLYVSSSDDDAVQRKVGEQLLASLGIDLQ